MEHSNFNAGREKASYKMLAWSERMAGILSK